MVLLRTSSCSDMRGTMKSPSVSTMGVVVNQITLRCIVTSLIVAKLILGQSYYICGHHLSWNGEILLLLLLRSMIPSARHHHRLYCFGLSAPYSSILHKAVRYQMTCSAVSFLDTPSLSLLSLSLSLSLCYAEVSYRTINKYLIFGWLAGGSHYRTILETVSTSTIISLSKLLGEAERIQKNRGEQCSG